MDRQTEAIINSLDDAIVRVDEQQRIVFLNAAAASTFACSPLSANGQPLSQIPALARLWDQLQVDGLNLSENAPRAVRRLDLEEPGQPAVPLEAVITRAVAEGKSYITAVLRDISMQQRMEEAVHLARKHQAVGALASGIAHDFNNILTAIISQLDLAIHSPDCPESLQANLAYAQTSARRGAELVAKLQLFSRQAKPKLAPLNLSEVVEQVVFVLRHSIDPRIELHWQAPGTAPWLVQADTSQVMQALINLGLNARDAMPEGGRLGFELANVTIAPVEARPPKKAGEFVRLTIADSGRGLAPETLARLFDRHYTTQDLGKGPSLGLSITFSVIAEHGGWIEADSQLGQGARFHVYLPRSRESLATAAPPAAESLNSGALEGRERILVVDDEEAVRMVIRAVLSYRGYQVVEARDGEEGIRKYAAADPPFDLVLMDLHMPRTNGHDALLRIQEQHPQVKAILLSGGLQDPDPESEIEIEGVRFLPKPFDNPQLVAAVRETLNG